jgi:hypothetical protein
VVFAVVALRGLAAHGLTRPVPARSVRARRR